MKVLGIETSQSVCSVGLVYDTEQAERTVVAPNVHSEQLLLLIQELCAVAKLDAVAVSIGPGSFTGLRIGLSTAKGLCYSLSIPLLAVPTFHGICWCFHKQHAVSSPLGICIDAKQGEYYVGRSTVLNGIVRDDVPVSVASFEKALTILKESQFIVTDCIESVEKALPSHQVYHIHDFLSGTAVASVGTTLLQMQHFADLATVEPLYLKDFVVKTRTRQTIV